VPWSAGALAASDPVALATAAFPILRSRRTIDCAGMYTSITPVSLAPRCACMASVPSPGTPHTRKPPSVSVDARTVSGAA
jgi:hypothetical protein